MKTQVLPLIAMVLLVACSPPKYAYYFDHYNYNSGRKQAELGQTALTKAQGTEVSPIFIEEKSLVANADKVQPTANSVKVSANRQEPVIDKQAFVEKFKAMSNDERKTFRKNLKDEMKKLIKAKKSGDEGASTAAVKAMDYDLKMAIIFGAVGVTLSLLGGVNTVFWVLSVIAIVIGVVFLIKWLSRQ
ncbi:MAG: hypothetical protein ACOYXT_07605 [Bacteroidota bacterium]